MNFLYFGSFLYHSDNNIFSLFFNSNRGVRKLGDGSEEKNLSRFATLFCKKHLNFVRSRVQSNSFRTKLTKIIIFFVEFESNLLRSKDSTNV